jgi:hypothetical protein
MRGTILYGPRDIRFEERPQPAVALTARPLTGWSTSLTNNTGQCSASLRMKIIQRFARSLDLLQDVGCFGRPNEWLW